MAEVKEVAEVEAEAKKGTGYRYWVRGSLTGAAPKAVPHKLTADEVKAASDNGAAAAATVLGSKWNQAGTWEEKVLSSWATGRVKELLLAVEGSEESCTAKVTEVTSCSGDASLVTVRQRKRVGYTFEIEMTYAVSGIADATDDIEGKMKVPEACYGELDDLELEVTVSASDVKDSALRFKLKQTLTKIFLPQIRRKLEEFEAELKER